MHIIHSKMYIKCSLLNYILMWMNCTHWNQLWFSSNWFNFALHRRVYSTVYSVFSECLWKNFTGDLGGIRTHDLLFTSADVSTSRPPNLPDDDIYRLMKFLCRVINNLFNFALCAFRVSECTVLHGYTRRCRAKLNQLFITRRKNFIIL